MGPLLVVCRELAEASRYRSDIVSARNWSDLVDDLRGSSNSIERDSYYMARVLADGSPLLVPHKVFAEHAHFLGDSGSGKSSLGPAPFIEQTILFGDASVIVIDLKADTLELLATIVAAAIGAAIRLQRMRTWTGVECVQLTFTIQACCCAFHRSRYMRWIRRQLITPKPSNVRRARQKFYPKPWFAWGDLD